MSHTPNTHSTHPTSQGHGGIRTIIDDMALLSTEAEGVSESMPDTSRPQHVNRANRVGALLGLLDDNRVEGASGACLCWWGKSIT